MTKEQILASLPKLTRPDLEAVHAVAGSLLGGRVSNVGAGASPVAVTVFDALVTTLGVFTTLATYTPVVTRQFEKRLPALEAFLGEKINLWKEGKVTQMAFLRMIFGLLADDLKNRGVVPTVGIMIVNMGRIPEVFDDAFPGYIESNMAAVILKRFQRD